LYKLPDNVNVYRSLYLMINVYWVYSEECNLLNYT
jgi:hypothetical protein